MTYYLPSSRCEKILQWRGAFYWESMAFVQAERLWSNISSSAKLHILFLYSTSLFFLHIVFLLLFFFFFFFEDPCSCWCTKIHSTYSLYIVQTNVLWKFFFFGRLHDINKNYYLHLVKYEQNSAHVWKQIIMMDSSKFIPIDKSCIALKSSLCWYVRVFLSKKFQLLTKILNTCIVGFFPLH